ncbi:MAG: glycosyltransferase family 4 protein [Chloroflexota bacterium]|nr:glycosyltransferase family 4 protein [Chloroflexota bacterium]
MNWQYDRPVALVSPRYFPAVGGVETLVEALAKALAREGVPVEVVTTDPTGRFPRYETIDGIVVRRFPTIGKGETYFLSPQLGLWLLRDARRYSLLHAHSYHTPLALLAALASRWGGVPLVVSPYYHGAGHSAFRQALHIPYRVAGRWLLRRARWVICISRSEANVVKTHFGSDVRVVVARASAPSPQADVESGLKSVPGHKLVLTVSQLHDYKRVDLLLAALARLPGEYLGVVVGDGPARPRLERIAAELGLSSRVQFPGRVEQRELAAWYGSADVFVSMSRRESFGLTVLEGAASGASVVASDIPSHREIAESVPGGRIALVERDCSPDELALAIGRAAGLGRSSNPYTCSLPAQSDAFDTILSCYASAIRDGGPIEAEAAARHAA